MDQSELDRRFAHHPPVTDEQTRQHEELRAAFAECARRAVGLTPTTREQSLMVTHLETGLFFGNAALARARADA